MFELKIRFHPDAILEAETARDWYADRNPIAAHAFIEEVEHAVEQVRLAPERWAAFHKTFRRYVFPRFPFSLVYRVNDDVVEVLAIAHHRRKPGYWMENK